MNFGVVLFFANLALSVTLFYLILFYGVRYSVILRHRNLYADSHLNAWFRGLWLYGLVFFYTLTNLLSQIPSLSIVFVKAGFAIIPYVFFALAQLSIVRQKKTALTGALATIYLIYGAINIVLLYATDWIFGATATGLSLKNGFFYIYLPNLLLAVFIFALGGLSHFKKFSFFLGVGLMVLGFVHEVFRFAHFGFYLEGNLSAIALPISAIMLYIHFQHPTAVSKKISEAREREKTLQMKRIANQREAVGRISRLQEEENALCGHVLNGFINNDAFIGEAIEHIESNGDFTKQITTMIDSHKDSLASINESIRVQNERVNQEVEIFGKISEILSKIGEQGKVVSSGVVNLSSVIDGANKNSKQSFTMISEINNAVDYIDYISNTIDRISEQANVLAMNALIESANSVGMGSGFGVVAENLREMSLVTKSEVRRIQDITRVLKTEIEQGIKSTRQVQDFFRDLDMMVESIFNFVMRIINQADDLSESVTQFDYKMGALQGCILKSVQSVEEDEKLHEAFYKNSSQIEDYNQKIVEKLLWQREQYNVSIQDIKRIVDTLVLNKEYYSQLRTLLSDEETRLKEAGTTQALALRE